MKRNFILKGFAVITCLSLLVSCNNEWDNHYSGLSVQANIKEYIETQPDLSRFYEMMEISGYDTILNTSTAYTVWAIDNDALEGFNLDDQAKVKEIIGNHISRFTVSSAGIQSKYIKTINGKLNLFKYESADYKFGGKTLLKQDILTTNGIVHVVDGYIPYQLNTWEYIQRTPGLDSLESFIYSQNTLIFDPENSILVGVDNFGNNIYDSAFIQSNTFMENIAFINTEDSIYTTILPNNTAWDEAYSRIQPYFVFKTDEKNRKTYQRLYTQLSLVWNMAFRDRIPNPGIFDSLISTNRNVFHQPANLFVNTVASEVSNGIVYVTDKMPFKPTDSWIRENRVEAEWTKNRAQSNCNIYTRNSYGSPLLVSNKNYILIEPTTTTDFSKVFVDFSISGTLSAKYNIYCVFVPATITDTTNLKPNKASFYIYYLALNGSKVDKQQLPVANNITNPREITKMLIASNFKFPVCDLPLTSNYVPTVKIRVQNEVTMAQERNGTMSRTMRIDCLILEPVTE